MAFGTFAVANIVSTGALNSGSITSGFGNIDTGSVTITTTGAVSVGAFTSNGIDDNADATAITIDSSENVLIGKTTTSLATAGLTLGSAGFASLTRSGAEPLNLNRLSSDGSIAVFYKDGTNVGNIGVADSGDRIYLGGGGAEGIGIDNGSNAFVPTNASGAYADNHISLGRSDARWAGIYTSDGLFVGGTGTANKLEDYEEGTFTPGLIDSAGGLGANLTTAVGQYTKVGNLVTFSLRINGDARNSTGNQVYITGLPFTFSPTTSTNRIQFELNGINLGLDSGFYGHVAQLANTDTSLTILMTGTTLENFRGHDLTPSYEIYTHGSYFTS